MASLTLKNLSDDLLQSLRDAAARDRRSLSREIVFILEAAVGTRPVAAARRRPAAGRVDRVGADVATQVAAWRKLAGKWESKLDERTEAKRILARRTRGRKVDF